MGNKIQRIYVGDKRVRPEIEYDIDISNFKSTTSFTSTYGNGSWGRPFSLDGTKRYSGNNSTAIYEYTLATPFDPTSMTASTSKTVSGQIHQVYLSPDGKHLAFASYSSFVGIWDLTTPNSLATATNYKTKSFSYPVGIWFKPDGTRMYVGFYSSEGIKQYNLSTPRDITTATSAGSLSTGSERGVTLSPDGTILIRCDNSNGNTHTVYQYSLSTPWDITTATQTKTTSLTWGNLVNLSLDGRFLIGGRTIAEFYPKN